MCLALKLSCGLRLAYAVWLFLWFTGQQRIQNLFKHLRWSFLVKIVTSNEINSLLRRWKGFWTPLLNVKPTASSGFAYILCLKSHVFFAISVQLDLHSKSWASKAFWDRSLRSCIYTVTFREMNILRTLKRLAAATKRFPGKQKFVKFRKSLYR